MMKCSSVKKEALENSALVFVYNANSGLFNTVADMAHKFFSPQTYQCNLCALTYSTFSMRKSWQEFLASLEIPFEFLHADELQKRFFIKDIQLPAIFKKQGERLTLLIAANAIDKCSTIEELKVLIRENLS
jgi:hypothetical protein